MKELSELSKIVKQSVSTKYIDYNNFEERLNDALNKILEFQFFNKQEQLECLGYMALTLKENEKYLLAVKWYSELCPLALKYEPTSDNTVSDYIHLSDCLLKLHRITDAVKMLEIAKKLTQNPKYRNIIKSRISNITGEKQDISDQEKSYFENEKGNELCQLGNFKVALIHLTKAVELNPANTDAWYSKGSCHLELNQILDALKCYSEVLKIDPKDKMSIMMAVIAEDMYDTKYPLLNQYLDQYDCNTIGMEIYRNCEVGDIIEMKKAISFFNKAVELDYNFEEARKNREKAIRWVSRFS